LHKNNEFSIVVGNVYLLFISTFFISFYLYSLVFSKDKVNKKRAAFSSGKIGIQAARKEGQETVSLDSCCVCG